MMGTLTRNAISFSYLDRGVGAPFVFQHGLGGDMSQPAALYGSPGRLICLECRGHGRTHPLGSPDELSFATFAADVLALVDELGLATVMLGGMSMGAGVALRFAAEHPDRVCGLVLVRPAWFDAPWPEHLQIFGIVADLLHEAGAGEAGKARLRQTDEYRAIAPRFPVTAASLLAQFDRPLARERAAVLRRLPGDVPLTHELPWTAVATPTLVLATRADPVHPLEISEAIASALPQAALREVTPNGDDKERHAREVTEAIDDFATTVRHDGTSAGVTARSSDSRCPSDSR
jgi:pimeloyl-ACP methyl ester carboxylesterase